MGEVAHTHRYQVLLEWDPEAKVWVTYVPALNYLSTFGPTRDEALANTREAIELYLESIDELDLPPSIGADAELVQLDVAVS